MNTTKIMLLLHAMLGDFGGVCFIWVFIEIINKTSAGLKRAKVVSIVGTTLAFLAWLSGGYYYLTYYGSTVKPVIKASELKWAHGIVMEIKEHVFLIIPILALVITILMQSINRWDDMNKNVEKSLSVLSIFAFLLSFLMAGMGALIAISARSAIGGGL